MDQGLPVNFENTASTWQNMPGLAAFYTGLQNQAAQDNIRMLQQAFTEEQAFKGQTRPLEVEKMKGLNELQAAQAMETRARGRQTGLTSDITEATMPSTISATNSKNETSVVKNATEAGAAKAETYNQLAGWLKGEGSMVPPTEQVRVIMDKLKLQDTPDRRVSTGLLQNVNKLPEILAAQYNHMVKSSPEYQKQTMMEEGDTKRANISAGASRYSADQGLAGVKYAADARTKAADAKNGAVSFEVSIFKLKKASEKIAALVDKANEVEAENPALAESLRARANDPSLMAQRDAELSAAGSPTVRTNEKGVAEIVPRGTEVRIPPAGGAKPQEEQKPKLADVKKMYPGVPDDKLRDAYKKKFGVDLQ